MSEVPDEIREEDQDGQGNPGPKIAAFYVATAPGQNEADAQPEDQQEQRNLVLKAGARNDPERNPQLRVPRFNEPDDIRYTPTSIISTETSIDDFICSPSRIPHIVAIMGMK